MPETSESSEQKRKLLERYLQARPAQDTAAPTIARRAPASVVPLTFAQEQIWLHGQLAPDSPVYNEPFTVHRKGPLDVAILERSFTEIIRRHEAWRTSFPIVDGQPVQVVHPPFEIKLPAVDLRNLPPSDRPVEALRLATEDARQPFDLAKCPLLRARLVRLDDEEFRLFVNCHHIIFDGVTGYQVFLPELVALYEAFANSEPSPLPELPFQYADYAAWQRESLKNEALEHRVDYWRQQLAGALPALQLPADRPRPAAQTFRGAMQPLGLSPSLSEALRSLSHREGVTLFMTLLAAFDTLLYRYSSQEDILVGSVTAGRDHPGTEKLLGFFLNTVVLRTDLSGNPSFRGLLERVRNTTLAALSHDNSPLDQIVRELHPDRDLSRNPLFQVLLSLEPTLPAIDSGWNLTPIDVETGTSKFDLCLVLDDRPEGLFGRVIYSTDLFDSATISHMMECWQTLLKAVVADPGRRISEIPILPESERHRLLVQWNDTQNSFPLTPVHRRFERQVEKTPDAVAVKCGEHQLTYCELDQRANQLAHHLRNLGVGPEVLVALCVERSLEMIIGILGILRAGGAYVPLDPSYPRERLDFMLTHCQAPVLLTQAHLPVIRKSPESIRVVLLDSHWNTVGCQPAEALTEDVAPENLAYVIYTSGSEGVPKGVEITHRNLALSTSARLEYYGDVGSSFLLLSSFAFDSSVAVIFHSLCSGGALILPAPELNWEPRRISELVYQNQISNLLCIPSLYREVVEAAEPGHLASLRRVIVAGESCPKQVAESHYRLLPQATLFNEYGPTEATVWSSVYRCGPQTAQSSVAIGRPIANTYLYVLDRNLQLSPTGVPGELCIGGEGVARGYLNRPDLTNERFLPNLFVASPGARMYRTGDLVRYLPDGDLQFLGRKDQQVKIRGMRIELDEIETVLSEHPDVREAVVTTKEDLGSPSLAAYVVARQQYSTSGAELRAFLKSRLPGYMVPSEFIFVSVLPRTSNGKIDRQALFLTRTEGITDLAPSGPTAPRDSIETRLLAIWREVLGTESSDISQDFFELGGHSLLAAKLLDRIEKEFKQSLSLAFVFQAPTIELMADWLRSPDHSLRARAIVPIQPQGLRAPLFWLRGGPRFRLLAQKLGPDQPFLGVDMPFSDASKLPAPYRLEDIASFLVRAMREVQPHGPYSVGGLCVNAVIAYEMARQLTMQGEEVALVALFDGHNQAYYKNPWRDGRYTGRIKYHLTNLLHSDLRESSAYISDRFDEARRKIERIMWQLSSLHGKNGSGDHLHDTDSVVHPAFHRYEPQPYPGKIVLFQSSDWPQGPYFDFELGWKDLVGGGIDFQRIPGDHPSMFTEPNVNIVAAKLSAYLSDAKAGTGHKSSRTA